MIRPAAGSYLWLLQHELRLFFRGSKKVSTFVKAVLAGALVVLAATVGVPLALAMRKAAFVPVPPLVIAVDAAAVALFTLMLSQAMMVTVNAFYERGDLDLLLSSPLPATRMLMIRCLGIVLSVAATYLMIATPVLVPVVLLDRWQILGGYGVIVALGLSATASGLLLSAVLFAVLGPRRTKTVGQMLAAFIGAGIFLLTQIPNLFRDKLRPELKPVVHWLHTQAAQGSLGPHSLASWPVRAIFGETAPLLGTLGLAIVFYVGAVLVAGARFADNAAAATGADVPRTRSKPGSVRGFRGGLRSIVIRKEWRLIWRDPALLAQVLLRTLYLMPLTLLLLQHASQGKPLAIAGGVGVVTVMASMIAGSLTWIVISAEDAPDLLASAPVSRATMRSAKLAAALLPVAVLSSPVLLLLWFYPLAAIAAASGIAAGSFSEALIQIWYENPAPRKSFRRRIGGKSLTAVFGGLVTDMGWGIAAGFAAAGSIWALIVAILPVGVLALLSIGANPEA